MRLADWYLEGDDGMGTDRVQVRWAGRRQMVAWDHAGHAIVMDTPVERGGEGTGARPLEAFLEALGACTATDVISVLQKKRQDVSGLEVLVTADQREDEHPRIYTRIALHYAVKGRDVDPAAVARAIELSEGTYCSVRGMLGPQTEVVTSYSVEDLEEAPGRERRDE